MLEVLLFVAVLSGLAAVGYLEWRARETVKTAQEERQSLAQADTALMTFATVNHRFPCPDTDRDGLENCGTLTNPPQKGWLPSLTLQLAGADPGVSIGQLRYLVQRGDPVYDLATVGDDWRPLEYDDSAPANFNAMRTTGAGAYQPDILTLADLCQRLETGMGTALAAGMAQVNSSPARPVAYALVHPGITDSDGNGSLFEGVNATAGGNTVEDPAKLQLLSNYDDRVLERSFNSLHTAFDCQPLFQSINTVALGLDVVDQVDTMRLDNIASAERAVIFAALGAAVTAVELSASIIEAVSDSGNAVADGVACGASLGLAVNACAAIGIHVGAAVLAGVSTVASTATIALNIAAAVGAGDALALANSSVTASSLTASCPTVDVSGPLAGSLADWNDAKANQITLQAQLTAKQAELAPAITARNNAYSSWLASIRYFGIGYQSSIDFRYSNLVNAGNDWYSKDQAIASTAAQVTLYQEALTSATNQVTDYDYQLANRTATIAALQAQIAALDLQIAAAPEGQAKEDLKLERAKAAGKLGVVNDLAVLQQERARAEADRLKAETDLAAAVAANASAQLALTSSKTSYQSAYSGMYDSAFGPYTIYYNANPASAAYPSFVSCTERTAFTTACTPAAPVQVQTQASVYNSIWDLYGVNRGAPFNYDNGYGQPHANSVFLRPSKIQKEVDALQKQVTDANQRVIDSKKRYDDLLAQASTPPTCNISGTGVTPWAPATAAGLLLNVDAKGATR